MKSVVIALGGNALLNPSGKQSFESENRNIRHVASEIALLCRTGKYNIVVTHGNGSEVGDELARNEHSRDFVPELPLYVLNAETQASIGTVLATSLRNKTGEEVCVLLAHVLVGKNDQAFKGPSKHIGPVYSRDALKGELKLDRFEYVKVRDGFRRVVASPEPKRIVELASIKSETSKGIVITCGGGGIPVVMERGKLRAVNAVIDKDLTSRLLANSIGAGTLVLLTNADFVYRDFGNMKSAIKSVKAKELKRIMNRFEEGSIKPKIRACIEFIENGGKEAYIGNVFRLRDILNGKSGTKIT